MQRPAQSDVSKTAPFIVSSRQVAFFSTFGYLKFPGLFKEEIPEIAAAFDEIFASSDVELMSRSDPAIPRQRKVLQSFVDYHPRLREVSDDPRMVSILSALLGEDYEYSQSDGRVYFKETSWHTDAQSLTEPPHIKAQFYLDPLRADRGAIRFIPGSQDRASTFGQALRTHLSGCLRDPQQPNEAFGINGLDVPCEVVETDPGDLLVWGERIFHASFGETGPGERSASASGPRRQIHGIASRRTENAAIRDLGKLG